MLEAYIFDKSRRKAATSFANTTQIITYIYIYNFQSSKLTAIVVIGNINAFVFADHAVTDGRVDRTRNI